MNFAQSLKVLRKKHGLLQMDLAKQLGVCKSTINKYEKSVTYPTCEGLCTLADYFNVTTDQLLGRAPLLKTDEENEVRTMAKDQTQRLEECLLAFVERVSNGGATTEAEVQVLPAVAQVLANMRLG